MGEFCSKHDGITFFDATPIFASKEGGDKHRLKGDLISPRGHPSEYGFAMWEGNIMGRLEKMIEDVPTKQILYHGGWDEQEDYDYDDFDDDDADEGAVRHATSLDNQLD